MHCTNCGAELRPGQKFCVRCGTPAPQPAAPLEPSQQPAPPWQPPREKAPPAFQSAPGRPPGPAPPAPPKRSGGVWAVAAVVLVAIAGLLAYRIYHLKHPIEEAAAHKPEVELSLPSSIPPAPEQPAAPAPEENVAKPSPLKPPEPRLGLAKHGGRSLEDDRPSILSRRPEPIESTAPAAPPAELAPPPSPAPLPSAAPPSQAAPPPAPEAEVAPPKPAQPRRPRPSILRPDPSEDSAPPARPSPRVAAEPPAERPAALVPSAPAAAPAVPYNGPSAGTLVWSGQVEKNTLIRIEGDQVSPGRLTGELPGVPVTIELPDIFAMVEAPSPANHWKRLYVRSLKRVRPGAVIKWSVR